jgi:hypothetical protein
VFSPNLFAGCACGSFGAVSYQLSAFGLELLATSS